LANPAGLVLMRNLGYETGASLSYGSSSLAR